MNDRLLPTFEPSEQDLIKKALAMPLERKIEKAILLIKNQEKRALELREEGFYVCDSYGKDSSCIVELCKMAKVKHDCNHNFTTIDYPELIRFGRKHRPDTIVHRSDKGHLILDEMVAQKKPPTRLFRWCCEVYKEKGGSESSKIIGVRISESARRAKMWKTINLKNKAPIIAPIVYWTDKDVWEFHKIRNLPYCELYDKGFDRLGCIGCPLGGTIQQKKQFELYPNYEKLWRKGFQKIWDRWADVPNNKGNERFFVKFGNADSFFDWWLSGKAYEKDDGKQCVFEDMMENR